MLPLYGPFFLGIFAAVAENLIAKPERVLSCQPLFRDPAKKIYFHIRGVGLIWNLRDAIAYWGGVEQRFFPWVGSWGGGSTGNSDDILKPPEHPRTLHRCRVGQVACLGDQCLRQY